MAVSVDTILDSVSVTLLDTARRTWSRAELLGYLNEALRATAFVKPDMYPVRDFVTLAAGIAQELPADGVALIDATDNEATGRTVTQTDLALLQEENRFWPAATQQAEVENYAADPRTPRRYYVFPPNDGTGSVRVTYGAVPAALTGSSVPPCLAGSGAFLRAGSTETETGTPSFQSILVRRSVRGVIECA